MSRRQVDTEARLRRRDRQVFAGNPAAASSVARPITPDVTFAGSGSPTVPGAVAAHLLRWSVSAASIADSGAAVAFDTEDARLGFPSSDTPGTTWTAPFDGIMLLHVTVTWASHSAGATVAVAETDLDAVTTTLVTRQADEFRSGTFGDFTMYVPMFAAYTYELVVTQTSGSAQTAAVTLEAVALKRNRDRAFTFPSSSTASVETSVLVTRNTASFASAVETSVLVAV